MVESRVRTMLSRSQCTALRQLLGGIVTVAALCVPASVHAQPVDDATRAASREAGREGLEAFDAGDYETAAAKLGAAYSAVQVPTLGLWLARALVKTGHLVEAAERYREVTNLTIQAGQNQDTQREAQADARKELRELQPRIPQLSLRVEGANAADVEVTVDGVVVPSTLLNKLPRPTNPGEAVVQGTLGDQVVTEQVTLAEGASQTVVLSFGPGHSRGAGASPRTTSTPAADTGVEGKQGSTQRIAGIASLAAGGVGLVLGSATGLVAMGKKRDLEDDGCSDTHCRPDQQSDVDSYNSMRHLSTAGFIIGGLGAAAGVTLLLTAPKSETARSGAEQTAAGRLVVWVGPGSAGLAGRF